MAHDTTKEGPSTGGSSVTYTNATPTDVTLGGIAAGSTFSAKTMQEMWDLLLYPYQSPAFSAFSISAITYLEVGDSISGSKTFTWTTTNSGNIVANSIDIFDVTGGPTEIESDLGNTGSKAHTFSVPIQKTSATYHRFRIQAVDTEATTFSRNLDIYWYWRAYYGEDTNASPLIEAEVKALRVNGLQSGFAGTYVFTTGGYKFIAYPAALGTASAFKDSSTLLDVDMQALYVVSITNSFGVTTNYNVHRTTYIINAAISIIVS